MSAPRLVLAYVHDDVRAETTQQVDRSILDNPEAVAKLASRLAVALKVFVELEYERTAN